MLTLLVLVLAVSAAPEKRSASGDYPLEALQTVCYTTHGLAREKHLQNEETQ